MCPTVTAPAKKQHRGLHPSLASGGCAGRCGLHCLGEGPGLNAPRQSEGTNLRQQTRLWDSYPTKSPNLRHCQACSQNKGLSRASWLWTGPSPTGDRQVRPEPEGGNCSPRKVSYTKLQADFFDNQDLLGFWMVDKRQEGRSQRSASQKRHMAHLRRHTHCTPRKLSGWDGGGDKPHLSTGSNYTCQHLVTWAAQTWDRHKT